MGLDSEFSVIRTQILATKPTPSLGTAYHLVAEDEKQRVASFNKKTTQEVAAFQAFVPAKCEGQQQKKGAQRTNKGALDNKTEHCTFCGRDGHNREGCFKQIGYPDWWPGKVKGDMTKPKAVVVQTSSSPIPGIT